jgi:hypothetical protein
MFAKGVTPYIKLKGTNPHFIFLYTFIVVTVNVITLKCLHQHHHHRPVSQNYFICTIYAKLKLMKGTLLMILYLTLSQPFLKGVVEIVFSKFC